MTSDSSPTESRVLPEGDGGFPPSQGIAGKIFLGPNGIRAGWRVLIAIALFMMLQVAMSFALVRIPAVRAWAHNRDKSVMTPGAVLLGEGIVAFTAILTALVMTAIEKRSFADYGLPWNAAFGKRFWQGLPYGFAMLTLLMALIAALHGFSLGGPALGRGEAVRYGFLYMLGFLLVAIFEEFSFRGYLQATLASGIGFWPAAVFLAIGFGSLHLGNPGEAKFGALMAGAFGLLAAFSLLRTGSIWFAIGMHAAWDWGETYFYSVPDSGILAKGHLLNSSFHGPNWLTGGSVGPEGSLFVFFVLALAAMVIHYLFPAKRETP
ncbi:MAG TPA: type II CAAX endopeptidase family protein [Candidatus Acidoferrales bacterium]|nr:type II CAAX endopeptidase family protein [Candidatus Acidoferrales bacterium]